MKEHNFQNNIVNIMNETRNYSLEANWTEPSSENIMKKIEEIYLKKNNMKSKIKKSNWIVNKLTNYNNVKEKIGEIIDKIIKT